MTETTNLVVLWMHRLDDKFRSLRKDLHMIKGQLTNLESALARIKQRLD